MVFMVGGKKSAFQKVKPVLDKIGKKTVYVGKNGDGAMLKLIVNHTLYLTQAAAIEGLVLGLKAGLDPDVMWDVMTSGAASSDLLISRGKDMIRGNFGPKGPMGLYYQLMLKAQYHGWDRSDATVVMRIYEELAGGITRRTKRPAARRKGK
jgi:2-hydroxymethylglutarate dehydrogenase